MKTSLSWRFAIILAIIALASVVVYIYPLRLGIDLAGGTSLLYELDLEKAGGANGSQQGDIATQVVAILKKRVDPNGVKNLIWRVIGKKRIQVQMPLADKETLKANKELEDARKALQDTSLRESEILHAINLPESQRAKAIDDLAAAGTQRNKLLHDLASANDKLLAAKAQVAKYPVGEVPAEVLKAKVDAQSESDAAMTALKNSAIDVTTLNGLLAAASNPANKTAQAELAALPAKYPAQKEQIQRVVAAYKKQMELSGGGIVDPADLRRLITAVGVLDFRITVAPPGMPDGISNDELNTALQSLKNSGPQRPVSVGGTRARWMGIDPNGVDNFKSSAFITADWAGEPYVLCYDDEVHALTHERRQQWSARAGSPYNRGDGIELPFTLDPVGASYMGQLTLENMHKPMAILLDDKAMSAPNINGHITDSGVITFGTGRPVEETIKEANNLKQIMDTGSLPAALQKDPISEVDITPDLGADNINAGYKSGIYALIAVVAFMLVYYTITGFFADLALSVNLLLVLATMAFMGGTFTLPGIAGLVLTLGMAVDANVLINERIREEIHKGASLWMAVKQGYDKVFWTIFDANTTCSLTSIVLIYVGSEEVKGFGVTLLIGLIIHMFTALFVTRTLMMGAIKVGIIRAIDDHSVTEYLREIFTLTWLRNGHFPFMRVITVTNIDWIGKRHIFWVISGITIVAGLVTFIARGDDKYDIEFRGGTQITFQLKPGVHLTRDEVEHKIKELKTRPGLADLDSARIYGVGKPDEYRFEMQTTIANPPGKPDYVKDTLLVPLAEHLKDVLNSTLPVTADDLKTSYRDINDLMDNKGIVRPITDKYLDDVFAKTNITGIPRVDVTDQVKGVAILLDHINPPQTAKQISDRISEVRGSPDPELKNIPNRNSRVIPVAAANAAALPESQPDQPDDKVPLTRVVIVSKDDHMPYPEGNDAEWRSKVAAQEWQIVQAAMQRESLFQGVTSFDAVVATEAKVNALTAIILSLVLIVAYVWVRFGGIRYGLGAIFSLVHDAIVAVAATVLAKYIAENWLGAHFLVTDFKINLTMIAAYLTVIGYSVNDTIVIFDRVRELRGKSQAPLSAKLINDAINQCFGRTIWTTFTVFIVVLIMYIWGGEGVRGFSYAMLIGVITGAYSTLAIASPMLLATATSKEKAGAPKPPTHNPFLAVQKKLPSP